MCYKLAIPAKENNYSMSSNKLQGRFGEKNSTSNSTGRSDERIIAALYRVTENIEMNLEIHARLIFLEPG
jgi:hypothetical protein